MLNGHSRIDYRLLGISVDVGVQRGLAEFRMGRPLIFATDGEQVLALPVDGADGERVAAFQALYPARPPRLAITARRAKALGIDTAEPVLVELTGADDASSIFALASSTQVDRAITTHPAGRTAVAAIELAKLALRLPALLIRDAEAHAGAILNPPLITVDAAAVAHFRQDIIRSLTIAGDAQVPLENDLSTRFVVFRDVIGGSSAAIIVGNPDLSKPVPVRLHSACLTGDVFGSRRCDCGDQLKLALERLQAAGGGVILYLDQEGRGLGLVNKIRAYKLQDAGLDTVDANTTLGFDDDERDYKVAARMLELLGCKRILLLTNNPSKLESLVEAGIEIIERLPLYTPINADNRRYLAAKAMRAGHWLDGMFVEPGEDLGKHKEAGLAPPA
jgi:GTP cyclohydrolase II